MKKILIISFIMIIGCGGSKQFPRNEEYLLKKAKEEYSKAFNHDNSPFIIVRGCDYHPSSYKKDNPYLSLMINNGEVIDTSKLDTIIIPNSIVKFKSGVVSVLGYKYSFIGDGPGPKIWGKNRFFPYYYESVEFYFKNPKTDVYYRYDYLGLKECSSDWIDLLSQFDRLFLFRGDYYGVKQGVFYYIHWYDLSISPI